MNTIVNTQSVDPINHTHFVATDSAVLVCWSDDQMVQESILNYLHEAGYASLIVTMAAQCQNARAKELLERDSKIGLISFVLLRDGMLRHYFRTPQAADFSLRVTAAVPTF
jgi:hypothetical protein